MTDTGNYDIRSRRQMPPMKKVAANVALEMGVCFRCGHLRPTERAHIIDRWCFPADEPMEIIDGLGNLLPLCKPCHVMQPVFYPGDEEIAWAWFTLDRVAYIQLRFTNTPKLQILLEQFNDKQKEEVVHSIAFDFDILDWPEYAQG